MNSLIWEPLCVVNPCLKSICFSYAEVFAYLVASHDFLSMIFGILGKFGIGIGDQKYFCRKIFVENVFRKKCRKKMLVENMTFLKKIEISKILKIEMLKFSKFPILRFSKFSKFRFFQKCHFSTNFFFDIFFEHFFDENVFRQKYFWTPIPIPNFTKIPKNTLRRAWDHFKSTKETIWEPWYKSSSFFVHFDIWGLWTSQTFCIAKILHFLQTLF